MYKERFKGIIFDMDGTLTVPTINFTEIRKALGIPEGLDLLKVIETYTEDQKKYHLEIIEKYEKEALKNTTLQKGVNNTLQEFSTSNIKMGIITRNTIESAKEVLSLIKIKFNPILTRDFTPVKPDPAPIQYILNRWHFEPKEVLMVGDYKDDITCGKNANTATCFFSNPNSKDYSSIADFSVSSFDELKRIVYYT